MDIANTNLFCFIKSENAEKDADGDNCERWHWLHDDRDSAPELVGSDFSGSDFFLITRRQAHIRQQDWQQKQIRYDDDGDPERGGDRELLDGANTDDEHRDETKRVGQ